MLVQINSQNLLKTNRIFHDLQMSFSSLHLEFFANRFCFANLNPVLPFLLTFQPYSVDNRQMKSLLVPNCVIANLHHHQHDL